MVVTKRESPRARRFASAHMTLSVTREPKLESGGIIIVVPAKHYKKSVDRHLLKRRARAILRNLLTKNKKPLKYVFFLKPGSLTLPFTTLREEFLSVLSNIDQ